MRQPEPTDLRSQARRFAVPAVVLLIAAGAVSIWGLEATGLPPQQAPILHAAAEQPGQEASHESAAGREAGGVAGATDAEDLASAGASIGIAQR